MTTLLALLILYLVHNKLMRKILSIVTKADLANTHTFKHTSIIMSNSHHKATKSVPMR